MRVRSEVRKFPLLAIIYSVTSYARFMKKKVVSAMSAMTVLSLLHLHMTNRKDNCRGKDMTILYTDFTI